LSRELGRVFEKAREGDAAASEALRAFLFEQLLGFVRVAFPRLAHWEEEDVALASCVDVFLALPRVPTWSAALAFGRASCRHRATSRSRRLEAHTYTLSLCLS
jgi:hypothetical protein